MNKDFSAIFAETLRSLRLKAFDVLIEPCMN
jgi:hypothetical protein